MVPATLKWKSSLLEYLQLTIFQCENTDFNRSQDQTTLASRDMNICPMIPKAISIRPWIEDRHRRCAGSWA